MSSDSLSDSSISAFLSRLASDAPTPGGGSVAALSGALAAALGRMAAAFTLGREKFAAVEPQARAIAGRLDRAREMLRELIDEDAAAYGVLSEAFKLDKSDASRPRRIEQAAVLAASVPLETAAISTSVLEDLRALRDVANPLLVSDVNAGIHLATAAVRAAAENVRVNLKLMPADDARETAEQLEKLLETAK